MRRHLVRIGRTAAVLLLCLLSSPAWAQDAAAATKPHVVITALTAPKEDQVAAGIAASITSGLELMLRLSGTVTIERADFLLPLISFPSSVSYYEKVKAAAAVFGDVKPTADGGYDIDVRIWNAQRANSQLSDLKRTITNILSSFDVSDQLSLEVASDIVGKKLAAGTLEIQNTAVVGSTYAVYIDGQLVGRNRSNLPVLSGKRVIIIAKPGPIGDQPFETFTVDVKANKTTVIALKKPESVQQAQPLQTSAAFGKRLALVIGNANYSFGTLSTPVNDAQAMAAKLEGLHFKVIKVLNGTFKEIVTAEDRFATELASYDVGLFYFSGDGINYRGTSYLLPVDAKINRAVDVQFDALNLTRVTADMSSARSKVNIVILDASRRDPFRGQFPLIKPGLATIESPSGTLVAASTTPGTVSAAGQGSTSPFTRALLENIATPGVDVQPMLASVFNSVKKETSGNQVPWSSSSLTSTFFFAPAGIGIAGATSSTGKSTAPPEGSLDLHVQAVPKTHGSVKFLVTQQNTAQPVTVTRTGASENAFDFVLKPGQYRVQAGFTDDLSFPTFTGEAQVAAGKTNSLTVHLDYSDAFKTEAKKKGIESQRSDLVQQLKTIGQRRKGGTILGIGLAGAGVLSGVGAGAFLVALANAYTNFLATSASQYYTEYTTDRTWFYGTAAGAGVGLLVGGILYLTRPSPTHVEQSIKVLDQQLAALQAATNNGGQQ